MELSEAVSELKFTKEIISILKEQSDKANSSEYNASIPSNFKQTKRLTYVTHLPYICNKSTLSRIFPDHLKFSIINPIYTKGDRMSPTSYRPISLLTSFLKVFEKVLYIRLTEHFYNN